MLNWKDFPKNTPFNNKLVIRDLPYKMTESDFRFYLQTFNDNLRWFKYIKGSKKYGNSVCFLQLDSSTTVQRFLQDFNQSFFFKGENFTPTVEIAINQSVIESPSEPPQVDVLSTPHFKEFERLFNSGEIKSGVKPSPDSLEKASTLVISIKEEHEEKQRKELEK